jgi:hypothetical protein
MRVPMKHKTTADDVRRVALAALATALEDSKQEAKKKPGLTGVRAVATGAVLYTAGRAAFTGRRFLRDRFGSNGARDEEEMVDGRDDDYDDEEEPEAAEDEDFEGEDDEEPAAEEDEDFEDAEETEEEPAAEEDEDFEDEETEDEPAAEEDEDFEDEDEDEEPRAEEDEDFDEEEETEQEPAAEEDEDFEDEDEDEEPAAEEDEDFEDEDEEDEERAVSSRRPPSHPKRSSGDAAHADLPSRPSRSRAPVGLS